MTELNEKHLFFHSKVQRLLSYHIKQLCKAKNLEALLCAF